MQSIENKIYKRICGNSRGWTFSNKDFADLGRPSSIDIALHRLQKSEKIRRICRGIYNYPKYSELLGEWLSPDIDQAAHALARRSGWRIQPSGNTALNLLGMSTQLPARFVYLSNGPSRKYRVGDIDLTFQKTTMKETTLRHKESALLVQAIKALPDQANIEEIIELGRRRFSSSERKRILKDTRYITNWIVEIIRKICWEPKE